MAERVLRRLAATGLAAALLAVAACGGSPARTGSVVEGVMVEDGDGMHGAVLDAPYTLPEATLTATDGQPYEVRERLADPLTLVFFGYTHCPDICQVVMADIASALTRLEPGEAEQVGMLFITSDPARDDPRTLRGYLDRFDPSFEGLTGPLPEIVRVAEGLHIGIEKGPRLPSGGFDVVHGTAVVGVRPDGSAPILWTEGTSPAKLAEDIHTLLTGGIPVTATGSPTASAPDSSGDGVGPDGDS